MIMAAPEQYRALGDWLIEEKGCQDKPFFQGYLLNPEIPHHQTGDIAQPDIVGVRYTRAGTSTARFEFEFHVVQIGDDETADDIKNTMGEMQHTKQILEEGQIVADTIAFYIALPSIQPNPTLGSWATKEGVGLLAIEKVGEDYDIRELQSEEPKSLEYHRNNNVLSNTKMESPGPLQKAFQNTSVLKELTTPDDFYSNVIKPEKDEYQSSLEFNAVFNYIDSNRAKDALEELVSTLSEYDSVRFRPHTMENPKLTVEFAGKPSLRIEPLRKKFWIRRATDNETLVRIVSKDKVETPSIDAESLEDVITYLEVEYLVEN